jgi:hypothetical protein
LAKNADEFFFTPCRALTVLSLLFLTLAFITIVDGLLHAGEPSSPYAP